MTPITLQPNKKSPIKIMSSTGSGAIPLGPLNPGKPVVPATPRPSGAIPLNTGPQYNSQNIPLLQAGVVPGANIPKPAPITLGVTGKPAPGVKAFPGMADTFNPNVKLTIGAAPGTTPPPRPAPVTTSTGGKVNPATGGTVKSQQTYGPDLPAPYNPPQYENPIVPPEAPTAPTATPTAAPDPTATRVSEAEKAYLASLGITDEEMETQEQFDELLASTRLGVKRLEGQGRGIPLELIRGKQADLEKEGLLLSEPLTAKLARLQAKRLATTEASKFALERADTALKTERESTKPVTLGAGETIGTYDSRTGKFKEGYTAPTKPTTANAEGFTLGAGQTRYDAFGNPIASAPDPAAVKAAESAGQATQGVIDVVDALIGSDTNAISGIPGINAFIPGTGAQKTKNLYDQLKGMLALQNRQQLKGSGAISDFEAKVLERAASALGRNLSDADFRATLQTLRTELVNARNQAIASGWKPGTGGASNANGGIDDSFFSPANF